MTPPTPASAHRAPVAISWRHRLVTAYCRQGEHPGKLRLLGWLRRLLAVPVVRTEVVPGVVMDLDDADYVQREILFSGGYELATLRLFDRLIADARGFLDIGGHHGQFTLRAARALAGRGGRVFAFEPTPANATALLHNAFLSGLDNIDLCTAALSDAPAILRMVQPHAANTGASRLSGDSAAPGEGPAIHVAVHPFGDFTALIPDAAYEVVKIDVEGHEARVLASLFASNAPRPRHIILEYSPGHFDYGLAEGLPAWLEHHGYTVRDVNGAPFTDPEHLSDSNLWAELRH